MRQARVVHLTGITPALSATSRALAEHALHASATVSLDVNYRAALWSTAEARAWLAPALSAVRFLFIGAEEARAVFGLEGEPSNIIEALAFMAPNATVTLLMGDEGSLTLDGGRFARPSRRLPVHVIDPIGAGDAYVAGFLWATLRGCDLAETVDTATAVAALKCSTWGDIALVSSRDVEEVLAGGPQVRR